MISAKAFTDGLSIIAASLRQVFSAEELGVFYQFVGPKVEPEEWERFIHAAVNGRRWTVYLPTLPDLLAALDEFRGLPSLEVEAIAAYERVIAAGVYTAEGGTTWSFRAVLEQCGRAAAEAFLEAGGHNAFVTTWRETDRRERFVEAYSAVVRAEPSSRLLPEAPVPAQLVAGTTTREDATTILDRLSGAFSAEEASPAPPRTPVVVDVTEERLARLRLQAAEIVPVPEGA